MNARESNPCLAVGQFWARIKHTSLVQVTAIVTPKDPKDYHILVRQWLPGGQFESKCPFDGLDQLRYLWFQLKYYREEGNIGTPGDVWVTHEGNLFFVGPDTTDKQIHVLADWRVTRENLSKASLFQKGHVSVEKTPPPPPHNAYEQILANADAKDD